MKPMYLRTCLAAAACLAIACERDQDATRSADPLETRKEAVSTDEVPAAPDDPRVIDAITSARCERELRCENIGPEKSYASAAACKSEIRAEWDKELRAMECGSGVVEEKLSNCLAQIRSEPCDHPIATLGRMGACQPKAICKER